MAVSHIRTGVAHKVELSKVKVS